MTDINIPILIPSYDPDPALRNTVEELRKNGLANIVIVDDGSASESQIIFNSLSEVDGINVIHHEQNRGKGAAIKTGLRFIEEKYPDAGGLITVDGDGQHLAKDVLKVGLDSLSNPGSLVLGTRSFSGKVPWRSRIGNDLTRLVSNTVHKLDVADTQTGLRFLPKHIWPSILTLKGERYEFEMDCLFLARRHGVTFREVPITTVYLDGNSSSHFRPIVDSFRVYAIFARFSISSIVSFLVDMGLFLLLTTLTRDVFFSAIIARCISGVVNFLLNKVVVFKSAASSRLPREVVGYIGLWTVINITSASLVSLVDHSVLIGIALTKIAIDASLFVFSFLIQKKFIFQR